MPITMKPASELEKGDVFSTDGYEVQSARTLYDGRVAVTAWLNASGGIEKYEVLAPDFKCPIWTPDIEPDEGLLLDRGDNAR